MKYLPINNTLFSINRERFVSKLQPKALAIFHSNDIMPTNADGTMLFRQNNDLFYLSGIDQEETILVLFPDYPEAKHRCILFIKETNAHIEIWEGKKLSKSEATELSGITTVYWTHQFSNILQILMSECACVYLNSNEHSRSDSEVQTRDARFAITLQKQYPLHRYERAAPIMHQLRSIKQSIEIELIKKAIEITANAFERVLKFVKPGVYEFEIEAEITHEFIRSRATRHAYQPIIASGTSSCILHYIANNKPCADGDVLLLDFGAEYANYNADLTRTIPVSGVFTKRQKQVYEAVLRIHQYARTQLITGTSFETYNLQIGKVVEEELIQLELLKATDITAQDPQNPLYKKYFMHGTSHHLGLDVHDVGSKFRTFEPGMVFTCEPGIYIKEEHIGIRLENNIVITEKGNEDLMKHIPIAPDDIEKAMKRIY